ncbi:MAG: hypothetical protein RL591_468, partial [Planctomycetota bacterium]
RRGRERRIDRMKKRTIERVRGKIRGTSLHQWRERCTHPLRGELTKILARRAEGAPRVTRLRAIEQPCANEFFARTFARRMRQIRFRCAQTLGGIRLVARSTGRSLHKVCADFGNVADCLLRKPTRPARQLKSIEARRAPSWFNFVLFTRIHKNSELHEIREASTKIA